MDGKVVVYTSGSFIKGVVWTMDYCNAKYDLLICTPHRNLVRFEGQTSIVTELNEVLYCGNNNKSLDSAGFIRNIVINHKGDQ